MRKPMKIREGSPIWFAGQIIGAAIAVYMMYEIYIMLIIAQGV